MLIGTWPRARNAARKGRQVIVWQGDSKIVISPEAASARAEAQPPAF